MNRFMNKFELRRWFSYFLLILAGIVAFVTVLNFSSVWMWVSRFLNVLSPFFVGMAMAYLLGIPCARIEIFLRYSKNTFLRRRARGMAVLFTYILTILLLAVLLRIFAPELINSLTDFIVFLPIYIENVSFYLAHFSEENARLAALISDLELELMLHTFAINAVLENFSVENIWSSLRGLVAISNFLIRSILALMSSVYILLETEEFKKFFIKLAAVFLPENTMHLLFRYLGDTNNYLKKFLYWNLIDGIIVGIIATIGLRLIGARYALILGFFVGVLNLIVLIGAIAGGIITTLIILFVDGLAEGIAAGIFIFVLQQFDGNVIKPKLFGESMDISPLIVLISVAIGGAYYGVIGIMVGIPLAAVLRNIVNDILDYRIKVKEERKKGDFNEKNTS